MSPARPVRHELPSPSKATALPMSLVLQPWRKSQRPCLNTDDRAVECDRWIYSTCLCFALDLEEQRLSGFHYQYSNYQIEYSRNLIFEVGGQMDQVFQALIDRSRVRLDLKTVKTILGCKRRPQYRSRKKRPADWEVAVERPVYDLTIFKAALWRLDAEEL